MLNQFEKKNLFFLFTECSRCGSINSTKSAIVVTNSDHLTNGNEFDCMQKSSTPSLRYKRCASNLSDDDEHEHRSEMGIKNFQILSQFFVRQHLCLKSNYFRKFIPTIEC